MKKTKEKPKAAEKPKPFFRPFEVIALPQKPGKGAASTDAAKAPLLVTAAPVPARPAEAPRASVADGLSFQQLMYGVAPLDRSKGGGRIPVTVDNLPPPRLRELMDAATRADEAARAELRALVHGAEEKFEVIDDGEHLEGRRADTPGKLFRSLRRGELTVDTRCDLHGLTLTEARAAVETFLRTARARGERVGLVIHGRGVHSPNHVGVLRGEIAAWLSQGAASACVDGFCTAVNEDGGAGALYILLRR